MRILFAGGGTGGHLYPGIAVADELLGRDPSTVVSFVGTARGLESRAVPARGLPLDLIRSAGLEGQVARRRWLRGLALLPLSALDAWRVLSRRRPDVVVGVGGYSSGPVLLLAALRGAADAAHGAEHRSWLHQPAPRAVGARGRASATTRRCGIFPARASSPAIRCGRSSCRALETGDDTNRRDGEVRVLIVGGSQGARAINEAMIAAAPLLAGSGLAITHQTGERDLARVREGYAAAGVPATVEPFFHDMYARMRAADVLVARAGASTLAELTVLGRASVLVPLPTAADDHQRKNARVLEAAGAAEVIEEGELTGTRLAGTLATLAADPARRHAMAGRARALGRPDAAARVADRIIALAGGH